LAANEVSQHAPKGPRLFSFGGRRLGGGRPFIGIFLDFFVVLNLFPSSSHWVLNMFPKFPMCSPICSSSLTPFHFIAYPLP